MKHLRSFNENMNDSIIVYIVLYWFWEGDSYLVNTYEDCFLDREQAIKFANILIKRRGGTELKVYLPGEEIPSETDGGYGYPGFIQIIEKKFN